MPINDKYNEYKVIQAIAQALEDFYSALIDKIDNLDIMKIMSRKNPYLYRAKAMQNASEIVESVLSAYVSSSEETIFGNCFFEPLAITASGGEKAIAKGVDITILKENTMYSVAVKSGTSVFNADSKERQEENFISVSKLAQQAKKHFDPIIGYAYGKKKVPISGKPRIYREVAGKQFWTELTGDEEFYLKIIQFMGTLPEKYMESYKTAYAKASNRLVREFSNHFCKEDGSIDWEQLVRFNSGD